MSKIWVMAVFITVGLFSVAWSDTDVPDVMTIVQKMEAALEAGRSGTRKVIITLKDGDRTTGEWIARRAHKTYADGTRSLLVLLKPESVKGIGYVFWKTDEDTVLEWMYFPATRRVRKLSTLTSYDAFIGTDFTYVDFGIKDPGGSHRLVGELMHDGKKAYKVETVPQDRWYYSRIVSWIDADNFLPIKRNYYNVAGELWKTKVFENITVFNNICMPLRIRMLDIPGNRSTEITICDVCYDAGSLPKETFDPEHLPQAASLPICRIRNKDF